MLRAHLYNITTGKLQLLEPSSLQDGAPTSQEATDKRADNSQDTFRAGQPQCRANEFMWVDVTGRDVAEIDLVVKRFGLHDMTVEDIHSQEGRPKLHDYGEYLYLIYHALLKRDPKLAEVEGDVTLLRGQMQLTEIDCVVGADYVVTFHDEPIPAFEDLRRRWERRPELMRQGPAYLLYELMDAVLDDYLPALDTIDEHIDELEDRLFSGINDGITAEIFSLKRSLLQIRHIAGPMRDVVNVLLRHDAEGGNRHFMYFQDLYDHASRIVDMTDTFREVLSGALDAYLAVESNRMNAVMKTLTAASIMLLVPNLIAAIYGMNFSNMPELRTRYGYFVALGVMVSAVAGLWVLFRRKKWI